MRLLPPSIYTTEIFLFFTEKLIKAGLTMFNTVSLRWLILCVSWLGHNAQKFDQTLF